MPIKKTILYVVTQKEHGGAGIYVLDLAKHLKDQYTVHIASGDDGDNNYLEENALKAGIPYHSVSSLKRSIHPILDIKAIYDLFQLYRKINPDVIHLNSSKAGVVGSIAGLFVKGKSVYTAHGWVMKEPLPSYKRFMYYFFETLSGHINSKTICLFKGDADFAAQKHVVPKSNVTIIHIGIDFENIHFRDKRDAKNTLKSKGVEFDDKKIALTIANLYKTKGLDTIIKTASELRDYVFVIIGEGTERKYLEKLIKKFKASNVFLIGRYPNAAELLKAADVMILTSVKEGLPFTILEALAADIPIIATTVGAIPEILPKESLISPNSPVELFEKLQKPLTPPRVNKEKYTLKKQVELTKKVYEELF